VTDFAKLEALTHVVIHHSATPRSTTFEQIEAGHRAKGWLACGYHVVILPDGTLRHGRRIPWQGAHAPDKLDPDDPRSPSFNRVALGVCLIGDNTRPGCVWTPDQIYAASKYLDALELVAPGLVILGHRDTGKATECPGIPLDRLLVMLGRGRKA
jgi:hypothetical protein